jgi:hypothetical protein
VEDVEAVGVSVVGAVCVYGVLARAGFVVVDGGVRVGVDGQE